MKGIILTAGAGSRLHPASKIINKGLLPVYDKPMIYYPLSTLMLSGIRDILIISTPADIQRFEELLGDGSFLGIKLSYDVQKTPNGIADCFIIGENFIGNDNVCLILGDNIFYGNHFGNILRQTTIDVEEQKKPIIFGYYVLDPERFGVVEFDSNMDVISIEEKPKQPKTNYAIPGLYIYDENVVTLTKELVPSDRGELEITDLNKAYLDKEKLQVELLGRGVAWLDTGTHKSLLEAGTFIETIESRQGLKVACLEEIAYSQGFITQKELSTLTKSYPHNDYRTYLEGILRS